jgi:hypothetical protein
MAVDCHEVRPGVRRMLLNRPDRLNVTEAASPVP